MTELLDTCTFGSKMMSIDYRHPSLLLILHLVSFSTFLFKIFCSKSYLFLSIKLFLYQDETLWNLCANFQHTLLPLSPVLELFYLIKLCDITSLWCTVCWSEKHVWCECMFKEYNNSKSESILVVTSLILFEWISLCL